MIVGDIYKLNLESIVIGGDALGRLDGKPVFVQGGAPLETVICRITEDRKTWARAELLEIEKASPARIEAACRFYGKCGGCNLQHINYETQLVIKVSMLKETFKRIGNIDPPEPEVFSSSPWEYRNRMQFHCLRQAAKGNRIGLKGCAVNDIITITDCPIADPKIREILKASSGMLHRLSPEKERITVFAKDDVLLSGQQKGKIKLLNKEIALDAGLFFQSNCIMLEKLILHLREIAKNADCSLPMADLYCGVGTFALYLCDMFPKVILAEENKAAISLARENLRGINTEFIALRDSNWPLPLRKEDTFGFAVIDPPRLGLASKLAVSLAKNGPRLLAYVSCDAASLARDSKILINGGYKLSKLLFFDFYPQTAHIESLAVFERYGS